MVPHIFGHGSWWHDPYCQAFGLVQNYNQKGKYDGWPKAVNHWWNGSYDMVKIVHHYRQAECREVDCLCKVISATAMEDLWMWIRHGRQAEPGQKKLEDGKEVPVVVIPMVPDDNPKPNWLLEREIWNETLRCDHIAKNCEICEHIDTSLLLDSIRLNSKGPNDTCWRLWQKHRYEEMKRRMIDQFMGYGDGGKVGLGGQKKKKVS